MFFYPSGNYGSIEFVVYNEDGDPESIEVKYYYIPPIPQTRWDPAVPPEVDIYWSSKPIPPESMNLLVEKIIDKESDY